MAAASSLLDEVLDLSRSIRIESPRFERPLRAIEDRAEAPVRVAVAGKIKAGKSTLLNALLGEDLAAVDAAECTRVVTWYMRGAHYEVVGFEPDGTGHPLPFTQRGSSLRIDLEPAVADQLAQIVVKAPTAPLRAMTMIDTPGTASTSSEIASRAVGFLSTEDQAIAPVDAVVYLLRHLHATDVSFLHAFHDREFASPSPVNCVGVLSRADEVAVGRLDAMDSATRIAQRYAADDRLRRLVQTVVPVAGLIGQAATQVTDDEYTAFCHLAKSAELSRELALLSVDRFLGTADIDVEPRLRAVLLRRYGLFGIRLAESLIRDGRALSSVELATALRRQSGVEQLTDLLVSLFGSRADVLKARSALLALRYVARSADLPPTAARELERIWVGAHEFAEMRALNLLRDTDLGLDPDEVAEAERLLGARGMSPTDRLGLPSDTAPPDQLAALLGALRRWRELGSNPVSSRALSALADVVARSCEGLYAQLA